MLSSLRLPCPTPARFALTAVFLATGAAGSGTQEGDSPPNVVIVLTDDQGYGDAGCQGHPTLRTPHIDALAASGMRLPQFFLPSSVCTPSRAALLTGCYPKRLGLHERVVFPPDDHGLHPDEVTLAELLGAAGYSTGAFGKWHLGHRPGMLPRDQGFDVFEGIPYSNDMSQYGRPKTTSYGYRLPWMVGGEVSEWGPEQTELTRRVTRAAVAFLEQQGERPFLLYVAHPMPHLPLAVSSEFEGQSPAGTYGDVLGEVDWSVGVLRHTLERLGVADNTIFVFSSDNGPRHDLPGRSAGPFRGGKGTPLEGGHRVPCFVSWPGRIEAGSVCQAPVSIMDWLPTLAGLTGAELPKHTLDGVDIGALLLGSDMPAGDPRPLLYYSRKGELAAIRQGAWKLNLVSGRLYNIEQDLHEDRDQAAKEPDRVQALASLAVELDRALTEQARPVGRVEATLFDPKRP